MAGFLDTGDTIASMVSAIAAVALLVVSLIALRRTSSPKVKTKHSGRLRTFLGGWPPGSGSGTGLIVVGWLVTLGGRLLPGAQALAVLAGIFIMYWGMRHLWRAADALLDTGATRRAHVALYATSACLAAGIFYGLFYGGLG